MIPLLASQIAEIVDGVLEGGDVQVTAAPVLNSSAATQGCIFLAFAGENLDGHTFVPDAFARGCVVAITTQAVNERHILVDDVTAALTALARFVREKLTNLTVIGITGSQGKTTTKDLLRHMLSQHGETIAPQGNYNNELGVPLTILECSTKTKFAIIEMGARHKGDIAHLASIAQPDIAVVLRVGMAHLGEFGSMELIAQTKSELVSSLKDNGIAILGQYDPFTKAMSSLHHGQIITFGIAHSDLVRATEIELREGRPHFDLVTPEGRAAVGLRIVGEHQVANALACAAVGTALKFSLDSIAGALSTAFIESRWRMQIEEFCEVVLINDSYNASPDAMEAALKTLVLFAQERGGRSWAFLGKMAELGESSEVAHQHIGTLAYELGIDHLVAIDTPEYLSGESSRAGTTTHSCTREEAIALAEQVEPGDVILVKASRSESFELIAEEIEKVVRENHVDSVENDTVENDTETLGGR
jgi:UDP-N-acetylmuramoyl-tripeptide--D-alanyl-D-alanine ligase